MNRTPKSVPWRGLTALLLLVAATAALETRAQDYPVEGFRIGDPNSATSEEPEAFRTFGSGWTSTASGIRPVGQPATLTWSVVPDNTELPTGLEEPVSNSNLIAFLDGVHHGGAQPGGLDLTQRAWFPIMQSVYQRWDELSGVQFSYVEKEIAGELVPYDDGKKLGSYSGSLGVRGDLRVGGHSIDGQTSPTFLAYNYYPNNADMVIDTDEVNRWGNAANNYLLFRNMMMHEVGHGLGLQHVESVDVNPGGSFQFGSFLMEPILSSAFDGPQFDDILGLHRLYGDQYEENGGNDTFGTATTLGLIEAGQLLSIGTDADDISVAPGEIDFVSIHDESDTDFFKITISAPQTLSITVTPKGPTYDEGPQGSGNAGTQQPLVASAKSNLTLALLDTDGTSLLELANSTGAGFAESIADYALAAAGDYYIRVQGQTFNQAQFFQLDIASLQSVPEPTGLALLLVAGVLGCTARRR
jgi:hypothetical protein